MDNSPKPWIVRAMTQQHDLVIVGGGLNGPVLALAAAQAGMTVALIDPAPQDAPTNFDGRSYALSKGSQRLLAATGLWEALADHAQPMAEIKVSDARPGQPPAPGILHFQSDEIEDRPMGYMVEDRHLRAALAPRLDMPGITRLPGRTAVAQAVTAASATVTLDDDTEVTGRLIVGCDGRASGTAKRAGITRTGWPYGQTGVVCTVGHEKPHGGIAHQQFLPSGPLAILPLTGNRCSIVWSETDTRAKALLAMDDNAFLAALRPVFGDFLGEISLLGPRFGYPLTFTLAKSFCADRLVLVGDAAHGMHPIAGQGLNAGLRDVAALIDVLTDARSRGEDIGTLPVLDRYARWRRFDVTTMMAATDLTNKLFSNDNALLRPLRDLGLGLVGAVAPLRRTFLREAAGLTGELPRLMR